ncbi:solute carrier family 2, facilitated glucose transporter member 8-like isoform X2 [Culex pipiens pallens]|uniref:solute carrier family 2, facilitated glucose transporter member 8-like isoform X2 n=1 Tax=Culex pipiens pallens TaxID=42434 RepID=UPI001954F882|nr:solute carrier family 2, facilitated glucose transporter member 8-like isoform X2 [Culex pipiens pallens]
MQGHGSARNQYLATFCVNLLSLSYGFVCGWTSPSIPVLQSAETPLPSGPITTDQGSWIGAAMCVGGFLGNAVSGWMADRYGRKLTACLAAIPQIISWIMVIIATNPYYLMVMRFLAGFSGGVCFMVIPMFIGEIAEDRIRGLLSSTLVFTCNAGILIMYILGDLFPYKTIPWILLAFPVLFLACFSFIPDTPFYLMQQNNYTKSENALLFYRGYRYGTQQVSNEFKLELMNLKGQFREEKQSVAAEDKLSWQDLASADHLRRRYRYRAVHLLGFLVRQESRTRRDRDQLAAPGLLFDRYLHRLDGRPHAAVRRPGGNHAPEDQRIRHHVLHGRAVGLCICRNQVLFNPVRRARNARNVAAVCTLLPHRNRVCGRRRAGNQGQKLRRHRQIDGSEEIVIEFLVSDYINYGFILKV